MPANSDRQTFSGNTGSTLSAAGSGSCFAIWNQFLSTFFLPCFEQFIPIHHVEKMSTVCLLTLTRAQIHAPALQQNADKARINYLFHALLQIDAFHFNSSFMQCSCPSRITQQPPRHFAQNLHLRQLGSSLFRSALRYLLKLFCQISSISESRILPSTNSLVSGISGQPRTLPSTPRHKVPIPTGQ